MNRKLPVALAVSLALVTACATPAETARQSEVAEKGQAVMPFDLNKTTHRFTPRTDGLFQEVVADNPQDANQVSLIREHLTHEAERFRRGDFTDPATIHGNEMPGLTTLRAGAAKITITYAELTEGASLTFHSNDSALVGALHAWGQAQVSDHGQHAEQGTN